MTTFEKIASDASPRAGSLPPAMLAPEVRHRPDDRQAPLPETREALRTFLLAPTLIHRERRSKP